MLVADGARVDTMEAALDAGVLPALARMRAEGGMRTLTTVFPSVTGPAYTPFLMGRFPGPIGLPGLRWYDRTRLRCTYPDYSRSYVGAELRHLASDLERASPTLFELAPRKIAAMSMVSRGLTSRERLDSGVRFMMRTARTHFRGDVQAWIEIDRQIGRAFVQRVRRERPAFAFAAFMSIDKVSHGFGHDSPLVLDALRTIDATVAALRADAERLGYWRDLHIWVVSDHGHSPVTSHDDLAGWLTGRGLRVRSHPWVYRSGSAALMVSGNAMAHLYLDIDRRQRPWWRRLAPRWEEMVTALSARRSVDLVLLPLSSAECEVFAFGRGRALVERRGRKVRYACLTGDPLGIGETPLLDPDEAHETTRSSDYPDALVQIASLATAPRSGDVILSASHGWDFRARYEPIAHVSSHGSLRREHMLVPFLHTSPVRRAPARTTELMPSALRALRLRPVEGLDGVSFI